MAPASALSVIPTCASRSHGGRPMRFACVNVWSPSSNPSRQSIRVSQGWRTICPPISKKVAGACSRRRTAATRGVQRGSGPSSKVSATRRPKGGSCDTSPCGPDPRIGRERASGAGPVTVSTVPDAPIVFVVKP